MEEGPIIQTQEFACTICKTSMDIEDLYCSECGYPEKGTEREIALYHARRAMQKNQNIFSWNDSSLIKLINVDFVKNWTWERSGAADCIVVPE